MAAFLFFMALWSSFSFAHIDAAIDIKLANNQELIVIFDAYEGYSRDRNLLNAVSIAQAIRNYALMHPKQKVYFSYEDPAVYDAGTLLIDRLQILKRQIGRIPDGKFIGIAAPRAGLPQFDSLLFNRPLALTTFLAGDLSHVLAGPSKDFWPINLKIASNDPRREHWLSLIRSKAWLIQHQNTLRMRSLVSASPLLKAKRALFTVDSTLALFSQEKISSFLNSFKDLEHAQVSAFANFASIKADETIDVKTLDQSIGKLLPKISLETVFEFLKETKDRQDIYADGPLVDILLTLFSASHPDKTIVILGNHLATRLVKMLDEMGVIISGQDIPDALGFITKLSNL